MLWLGRLQLAEQILQQISYVKQRVLIHTGHGIKE